MNAEAWHFKFGSAGMKPDDARIQGRMAETFAKIARGRVLQMRDTLLIHPCGFGTFAPFGREKSMGYGFRVNSRAGEGSRNWVGEGRPSATHKDHAQKKAPRPGVGGLSATLGVLPPMLKFANAHFESVKPLSPVRT